MIVVSLLLILVAVTLLVLGLAGGSSMLLISSIVASLLAAVALVIGARHAAAQRRAVTPDGRTVQMDPDGRPVGPDGLPVDLDGAAVSAAAGGRRTARARRAGSDFSTSDHSAHDFVASEGDAVRTDARRDRVSGPGRATSDFSPSDAGDADLSGSPHPAEGGSPHAVKSGDREGGLGAADDRGDASAAGGPRGPGVRDEGEHGDDRRCEPGRPAPDYDRASSVIDAARTPDPAADAWRRDPDAEVPPTRDRAGSSAEPSFAHDAAYGAPAYAPEPTFAEPGRDGAGRGDRTGGGAPAGDVPPGGGPSSGGFAPPDGAPPAGDFPPTGGSPLGGEFDEPDDEDPADEPLPQAVRPGDAVRVARMDNEVLVVDGRPRYHLADCPHLVGRLTEPLPAREAVELGFSPCGLCRPVDRLVAQSTHR